MSDQQIEKSWWPTRKWWVGLVTSVAALVSNIVQADHWSKEFSVAIVTVVAGALTAYIVPNSDLPGGYVSKQPAKQASNPADVGRANLPEQLNDDRVLSDAAAT